MLRLTKLDQFERSAAIAMRQGRPVKIEDAAKLRADAVRRGRHDLVKLLDSYDGTKSVRQTRQDSGYAVRVVSTKPGKNANFNRDNVGVVLGRFEGAGETRGSLDVYSLGEHGEMVVELGRAATKLLVVAGNSFKTAGRIANPEPVAVYVSNSGRDNDFTFIGKAGFEPVHANSANRMDARRNDAGGDRFNLEKLGVTFPVRFVKLVDLGSNFDLDGVFGA